VADPRDEATPERPDSGAASVFNWSGDEAETERLQEQQTRHYVRWTFFTAVAVVIVSVITVGLALLHRKKCLRGSPAPSL